jgi:hypothetical protein
MEQHLIYALIFLLAQFIIGPNGVDGMEFARVLRIDYGE